MDACDANGKARGFRDRDERGSAAKENYPGSVTEGYTVEGALQWEIACAWQCASHAQRSGG